MTDKTKKFMKSVRSFLKERYGKIKPEWEGSLDILESSFELQQTIRDAISKGSLTQPTTSGGISVTPLLKALNDEQTKFYKYSLLFGLTPLGRGRLDTSDLSNKKLKVSIEKETLKNKSVDEDKEEVKDPLESFLHSDNEIEDDGY